ncbi:hypothetical protein Tco_0641790 [Tanacetum coccineum]
MPQDQEENPGNDDEEPKEKVASKRDWFTKPTKPQELTDPDWNVGKTPQQGENQSWLMTLASSANKPSKTFDELMSTPIDFSAYIMNGLKINNLTQETLLGPAFRLLKGTRSNYVELEYDFEECYKALLEKLDWENPKGDDYPFDLTKPLPLVMSGNHQKVPVDYFFNNDLNPVKVAYDKHALWGISHWREQRKTFYGYARGLKSTHDVYSTKRILAVTHVKEGDFPCLCINDIEDMLLLVVQNRLTNLSGDDVSDFAIALRMFTRCLVIQKQVKNLQLRVEIYQKKINVTKPDTTKSGIRKRDPYTPYQDPQGFIYVNNNGRNSERDRLIVVDRDMFVMFERERLNVSIMRMLRLKEVARKTVGMHLEFAPDYAFSDSLLLTPLCCDDIHDVTPRVSALAGYDILVSEPLVIKNLVMFSPTCKKSRWGTIFPTGLERYKEPLVEPKEIG